MTMREADVQKWVRDSIEKAFEGYVYAFKVPQGQYTSRRGIPDLVFSIHGRFVAVEVKTETGSLTKLQQFEIDKICKAYGRAFVIYGKDESALKEIIEVIKNDCLQ